MRKVTIRIGSEIDTIYGKEVVTGWNGHLVSTDSYGIDDNGEYVLEESRRRLTLNEVGHLMSEGTGYNYKVRFEEEEDEEGEDE